MLLLLFKNSVECCALLCIRQKDFENRHRDLGNDNRHGNDDTVPPKGLPKRRGAKGSSKMSTGNALLLLDPKQKIMTLESTCKTQKCPVGNLAGTGSPDIAELASAYFGTFSHPVDCLSSMLITNQEEQCDLPMQMVGQFEQPVLERSSPLGMCLIRRGLHVEIGMVKSRGYATGTHLCIFFQLHHVGGRPRHQSYRGKTETSWIQLLMMWISLTWMALNF